MLGLCAILLIFFAFIGVLSYWVSWELLDKRTRPSFTRKLLNDFSGLIQRERIPESAVAAEQS